RKAVIFLDPRDAELVTGVPPGPALQLDELVFRVGLPGADRFPALPVRDADPDPRRVADGFDAEKARLPLGQLDHSRRRLLVTRRVRGRPHRGEDHGVVRRRRRAGQWFHGNLRCDEDGSGRLRTAGPAHKAPLPPISAPAVLPPARTDGYNRLRVR